MMAYNSAIPSTSLPGPVTAPASNLPNTPTSTPLQQISTSSGASIAPEEKFQYPWKSEGYKAFSAWMASEDDFFIFRRFQSLNARTILWMQDRITKSERELKNIDEKVEKSHLDEKLRNDSMRWDETRMQRRHQLMLELSQLLHHYNSYIDSYAKLRARPRADQRQIENIKNWLDRGAIVREESSFIENIDDLTSINYRTRPPLGRWLESFQRLHRSRFFRAKDVSNNHQALDETIYSSNARFDALTTFGIILGGLIMLLAPLWWLEYVNQDEKKLGVMTGFICVFVGLMSLGTVNRPGEVVAATAAYAAVLMVFMQVHAQDSAS